MRNANPRVGLLVWLTCLTLALGAVIVGAMGLIGVRSATGTGEQIATDEVHTLSQTTRFGQDLDSVHMVGIELALSGDPARRAQLHDTLDNTLVPAIEADLAVIEQIHASDDPLEKAHVDELVARWAEARRLLTAGRSSTAMTPEPAASAKLESAFDPLDRQLQALLDRERTDAISRQDIAEALSSRITQALLVGMVLVTLVAVAAGWRGSRLMRRAMEPAKDQVDFSDALQLAEDERDTHQLLQRHLEHTVVGASVTVLNRNNSADRLEAMTTLPPDSPLGLSLRHAEPRSCLAVRSGRTHDEGEHSSWLLACRVCSDCLGRSTCTPLTVGGEVIGSVLVSREISLTPLDQQRIRESVAQSAPVLANLRNLAIAELRAATDSLTGLPNKRAVADTLKRMVAQASLNRKPLSFLMLDLDHFRDINERFGHPAGDQALASVGAALRAALRNSDFAGRNGGEEFVVILPDTELPGAMVVAESIRVSIEEITLPGLDLLVTASIGIAAFPSHSTNAERLERLADSALYVAKRSGRNRIEIATPTEPSWLTAAPTPDSEVGLDMPVADVPVASRVNGFSVDASPAPRFSPGQEGSEGRRS